METGNIKNLEAMLERCVNAPHTGDVILSIVPMVAVVKIRVVNDAISNTIS